MYCGSEDTVKNGHVGVKQLYKCKDCGRQFVGGERINAEQIWHSYVFGHQTIRELSVRNNCSEKTIRRKLANVEPQRRFIEPRDVILEMDTTYFGRGSGLMVFLDALKNEVLLSYWVKYETTSLYVSGVNVLRQRGFRILGIVCDGRKGLAAAFGNIRVQLCQFHQIQAVRRYLTLNPKLQAGAELLALTRMLPYLSKAAFIKRLSDWKTRWNDFLQEKTTLQNSERKVFTHRKLRSAYRSLKSNSHWLFVFEGTNLPRTTSALEGLFSHLKRCLHNHNGLSDDNRSKIVFGFLEAWGNQKSSV